MIDGANIQHYGYLIGCGAAVLGSGLVGLLLGRAGRQKSRDRAFGAGWQAGFEQGRENGHAEGYQSGVSATGYQPVRAPHTMVLPRVDTPPPPPAPRPVHQVLPVRRREAVHAKPEPRPEPQPSAPTQVFDPAMTALLPLDQREVRR